MTLMQTIDAAQEIGVSPRRAVMARLRFLMPLVREMGRELYVFIKRAKAAETSKARDGLEVFVLIKKKELEPLKREAEVLTSFINGKMKLKADNAERIPSWMVEKARQYPISELLGQKPKGEGKAVCCPFHQDNTPSASVKRNILTCFAGCAPKNGRKGWDPISLLMERDGLPFRDAVLALQ